MSTIATTAPRVDLGTEQSTTIYTYSVTDANSRITTVRASSFTVEDGVARFFVTPFRIVAAFTDWTSIIELGG